MKNTAEKTLVFDDFADKVGEVFAISEPQVPAIPLTLVEADKLPARVAMPGVRPPFSLIFLGRDPRVLPQRLYRLEHNGMGTMTIFLVHNYIVDAPNHTARFANPRQGVF